MVFYEKKFKSRKRFDRNKESQICFIFDRKGSWGGRGGGGGGMVVGSPGVGGTSNSSSSSSGASWRSGTPSPPLSDEGAPTTGSLWPTSAHSSHNQQHYPYNVSGSSSSSTPGSTTTLDEGIVPDYLEEQHPRKKKVSSNDRYTHVSSFFFIDRSEKFVIARDKLVWRRNERNESG